MESSTNRKERAKKWFEKSREKGFLLLSRARSRRPAFIISLVILAVMLAATTISWQQAWVRVHNDSQQRSSQVLTNTYNTLQARLMIYSNILSGTKAFFESSEHVTAGEFDSYFSSLQVKQKYAGFSAISYVAKVPEANKSAFIAQARADTTLPAQSKPNYTIYPTASRDVYYPILYTYKGSTPLDTIGYDLGTSSTRIESLEATGAANSLALSNTLNLNSSDTTQTAVRPGFSMTVPVYSNGHYTTGDQPVGFLVASFEHKLILADLMASEGQGALLRVFDQASGGTKIYEQGDVAVLANEHRTQVIDYSMGGKTWRLELNTPMSFGISSTDQNLPRVIGVAGLIITALLLAYFLSGSDLSRRRRP